jgi:hypothetical protein
MRLFPNKKASPFKKDSPLPLSEFRTFAGHRKIRLLKIREEAFSLQRCALSVQPYSN